MSSESQHSEGGARSGQSEHGDDAIVEKKLVLFDEDGRPVGDKSADFSSSLGEISRAHAPIVFQRWKEVPDQKKDLIWELISKEFVVTGTTQALVLKKANEYWRKYKSKLRKIHDKFRTDEERKRNCPGCVRQEDWERFVDNESMEAAKLRRVKGKISREAAKARHRSGRKGSARLAHDMKKKNPNTLVTRTLVYVALHTNDDGTCPTEEHRDEVESIKEIAAKDPSSTLLDLDHDPVARVYGPDSKGRVRGMGSGVTKRGLDASAPAKYQLKKQKEKESALVGEVENLKVLYQKMQEDVNIMKSAQGSNAQFSPDSSHLNHHGPAPDGFPSELSSVSCKLYSMRRVHVASGRAILGEEGNQEIIQTYDVVLDLVLVPTAQSTHMETLGEEEIGGIIEWPKAFTVFNC
ncbi:hypothetical protein IFM89_010501 [Coptis chinensis]|uniref:Transposase Tnp1/En/Spm-like domain-containing protein n=1 Tax=Coptis chinensis TaxID=261450 RepID=A0A835LBN3_9MAGN|nr:hypothetical protein IFM89_010501 [Coptis chinensis]